MTLRFKTASESKKQKGQIAIFLALVFFVMFSIFGMTISTGMFIHDKINLQNSTDLASYYVAGKQAEILGAIAHSNYQIRQSWKLLAFRYRVMGNASRTVGSALINPGILTTSDSYVNDVNSYIPAAGQTTPFVPPKVCMGASHVFREVGDDNICKTLDFSVSYIPTVPQIIGIGIVGATNNTITSTNQIIANTCSSVGYLNWWYANTIVGAHKLEQRNRRAVIERLAENLALPIAPGGMKDLDGQDVFEGARKTFSYNLTEANRIDGQAFIEFENSLEGIAPSAWLSTIYVNLVVPWSFYQNIGGCQETVYNHPLAAPVDAQLANPSSNFNRARAFQATLDPDDRVRAYGALDPGGDQLFGISVGIEKNPWYMVYNKATGRATAKPLFLSDVFGVGINMSAVAYAKPFGGRIGPWFEKTWPSGGDKSSGGGKTDELLPTRVDFADLGAISDSTSDPTYFPNYSRHPGDQDGLTTRASQVFAGRLIGWDWNSPEQDTVLSRMTDYIQATYSYFNSLPDDPLAINSNSTTPWESFNRNLEIAAVRPDAFDMLHYSISPTFYNYYIKGKLDQWLGGILESEGFSLRGDLGSYNDPGAPVEIREFDIRSQLDLAEYGGVDRTAKAPWVANTNKSGFLSGWIPGQDLMDFGAPDPARFGVCQGTVPETGKPIIPSECIAGGRVGYSVKLVSKKYLEGEHPIGGGGLSGPLANPPL